jgi:hypothetical protein
MKSVRPIMQSFITVFINELLNCVSFLLRWTVSRENDHLAHVPSRIFFLTDARTTTTSSRIVPIILSSRPARHQVLSATIGKPVPRRRPTRDDIAKATTRIAAQRQRRTITVVAWLLLITFLSTWMLLHLWTHHHPLRHCHRCLL